MNNNSVIDLLLDYTDDKRNEYIALLKDIDALSDVSLNCNVFLKRFVAALKMGIGSPIAATMISTIQLSGYYVKYDVSVDRDILEFTFDIEPCPNISKRVMYASRSNSAHDEVKLKYGIVHNYNIRNITYANSFILRALCDGGDAYDNLCDKLSPVMTLTELSRHRTYDVVTRIIIEAMLFFKDNEGSDHAFLVFEKLFALLGVTLHKDNDTQIKIEPVDFQIFYDLILHDSNVKTLTNHLLSERLNSQFGFSIDEKVVRKAITALSTVFETDNDIFGLRLNSGSLYEIQEAVLTFGHKADELKHYPRLIVKPEGSE